MKSSIHLAFFAALTVGGSGCDGTGAETSTGEPPPMFVEMAKVESIADRDELELVGQLAAERAIDVSPEVAGVVAEIAVPDGAEVEEGGLLFRLRSDVPEAAAREARARRDLAADEWRRAQELAEQDVLSEAEVYSIGRRLEMARADLALRVAELSRYEARAPFAGRVGAWQVSVGQRVRPESVLVDLTSLDPLRLDFTVPERYSELLREGLEVEVAVADVPERRFEGTTYFVAPRVNSETRRLLARARVPNAERRLRPGQFASIFVVVGSGDSVPWVPHGAVVRDPKGPFVWKVVEGRAVPARIELGGNLEHGIRVESGLSPGETIVTSGTNKVFPNAQVLAPPPDGAPAPRSG